MPTPSLPPDRCRLSRCDIACLPSTRQADAWSYAAVRHLGLSAELVFYPGSFTGWATALVENFGEGRYLGVPLLQRYGMAVEPRFAAERGVKPYPHMIRWLR